MNTAYIGVGGLNWDGWLGYGGWSLGWRWLGLLWLVLALVFCAGLSALLVWAVRASAGPRGLRRAPDTAAEVLQRRLAAGEISHDEYKRIQRILWD